MALTYLTHLDEEAFRYNERKHADGTVKKDGERFIDMAGRIDGKRLTYKKLTGKEVPAPEGGGGDCLPF